MLSSLNTPALGVSSKIAREFKFFPNPKGQRWWYRRFPDAQVQQSYIHQIRLKTNKNRQKNQHHKMLVVCKGKRSHKKATLGWVGPLVAQVRLHRPLVYLCFLQRKLLLDKVPVSLANSQLPARRKAWSHLNYPKCCSYLYSHLFYLLYSECLQYNKVYF